MSNLNLPQQSNEMTADQSSNPVSSPEQPRLSGCYVIRCALAGHYALFEPTRQLFTFVGQATAKVELSFSSSRLLELLIRKSDTIVSRESIMEYAWPGRVVTQSSLNQAVSSIREQLGDEISKEIVQTMPRRGYQFNSRFLARPEEWPVSTEETATTISEWRDDELLDIHRSSRNRSWWSVNALPLGLFIVLTVGLIFRINWILLLQPGLTMSAQYIGNQQVIYTAPDEAQLASLQVEVASLRLRLMRLAGTPGTLLFNRMYNFYDVICMDQDNHIFSIFAHKTQLLDITDKQLAECLK